MIRRKKKEKEKFHTPNFFVWAGVRACVRVCMRGYYVSFEMSPETIQHSNSTHHHQTLTTTIIILQIKFAEATRQTANDITWAAVVIVERDQIKYCMGKISCS